MHEQVPPPCVSEWNDCGTGLSSTVKVQASPGWLIMDLYISRESGPQGVPRFISGCVKMWAWPSGVRQNL